MNSAMTITQWDVLNSNRESAKPAKLSQEKVRNIDDKYKRFSVKPVVATETPVVSRTSYKDVLTKFRMSALNYGDAVVKLSGGRKLKVNPIVRNGALRLFKETITNGDAINVEIVNNPVVNEPKQEIVSNVREFPSRVLATPEYSHNENVSSEPVNNMYSYPTGKPVVEAKLEVNNEVNNNNLSRLSRMDYNNGVMAKEEPKEVKPAPVHTDIYSSTDYVQQKLSGNLKTNSDQDIAQLVEGNKKLDGEISESQSVLQQLEAQLAKLKEVNEAQRQARINELEEEKLSKTATLNGLTEQIKALQEAIRQEQRSANEQTSYRRSM